MPGKQIRPLLRWYVDMPDHGLQTLNGSSIRVRELLDYESRIPASWETLQHANIPSQLQEVTVLDSLPQTGSHLEGPNMAFCFWTQAAYFAIEFLDDSESEKASASDSEEDIRQYWLLRSVDGYRPGTVWLDGLKLEGDVGDPDKHICRRPNGMEDLETEGLLEQIISVQYSR
jgi:hypothetical protein